MKTQPAFSAAIVAGIVISLSGCQTPNFYYASDLPQSLRAQPQVNTRKIDLAPLASMSGGGDQIVAGDVLEITVSTGFRLEDQVPYKARVGRDGTIRLPNIEKSIDIAGLEPQAAEALITQESINSGQFRNPRVTIEFLHQKMNKVRVLGGVKESGLYEFRPGSSDVVSVMAAAGGLAENAGSNVSIRNPPGTLSRPRTLGTPISPYATVDNDANGQPMNEAPLERKIDLAAAAISGPNTYQVADGGTVVVEEQDLEPIQIRGLVREPGSYDYPMGKRLTVLGALSMAKDVNNIMADKVYVIRQRDNNRYVVQCSIREAKKFANEDMLLEPGDIVSVEQSPATVGWEAVQLIRFGISGSTLLF